MTSARAKEHATAGDWNPSAVACIETITTPPGRGLSEHPSNTVSHPQSTVLTPKVESALNRVSAAVQRALVRIAENEARAVQQ